MNRPTFADVDRGHNVVSRIVCAQEAILDHDLDYAHVVLVDLERELVDVLGDNDRNVECGCGARFRWPGELQHHMHARWPWNRWQPHGEVRRAA
jgi:hypothetical protein